MKRIIIGIIAICVIGISAWVTLHGHRSINTASRETLKGTKLVLVAQQGKIKLYVDLTSTNKIPDYAVMEGYECVMWKENVESNIINTTYAENGLSLQTARSEQTGKTLRRILSYSDESDQLDYLYMDTHGDGLWDFFSDRRQHLNYVRSNLCWVLKTPVDGNQR